MAYIGRTPDIGNFEKQILTPDSVTTTFALTYAVGSANSLYVNYGGVPQEPQVAYSVSGGGQQIVFSEAPVTGTTLYIIYYGKQLTTPRAAGQETTKQTFAGDGSTVTFTLTDPPVVPAGIMVFVDGILQREGSGNNYVSSGSTITFSSAPDSSAEIDVYTLVKEKVSIDTVADGSITFAKLVAGSPTWNGAGETVIATASTGNSLRITNTGSGNSLLVEDSASTDASPFVITAGGDVGIGTSTFTAGSKLSVQTTAGKFEVIAEGGSSVKLKNGGALTIESADAFYFNSGASERMRLTAGGELLIGTTIQSPNTTGQIMVQTGVSTKPAFQYGSGDGNWFGRISSGASGGTIANFSSISGSWSVSGTTFSCTKDFNGTFPSAALCITNQYNNDNFASFRFLKKAAGSTTTDGAVTEMMVLNDSGNLGIGTSSPVGKLSLRGAFSTTQTAGLTIESTGSTTGLLAPIGFYLQSSDWGTVNQATIAAQQVSGTTGGANLIFNTSSTGQFTPTERMRIDSSGNLGVGTTSPSYRTHIVSAATNGSVTALGIENPQTAASANLNATVDLRFDFNGTSAALIRAGKDGDFTNDTNCDGNLQFYTNLNNQFAISAPVERMRIDSSGNLLVGKTSQIGDEKFGVLTATNTAVCIFKSSVASYTNIGVQVQITDASTSGSKYYAIATYAGSSPAYRFIVADSGTVTNATGTYGTISDVKLKENIVDATPKLADLMKLQVRNFNLKSNPSEKHIGFIAQEMETVFPAMVESHPDRDADGNTTDTITKTVKTSILVPMLVKSIQELKAIVDAQAVEIAALKAK